MTWNRLKRDFACCRFRSLGSACCGLFAGVFRGWLNPAMGAKLAAKAIEIQRGSDAGIVHSPGHPSFERAAFRCFDSLENTVVVGRRKGVLQDRLRLTVNHNR